MNALDRVAAMLGRRDDPPLIRIGGSVREIGAGHCRIRIAVPLLFGLLVSGSWWIRRRSGYR